MATGEVDRDQRVRAVSGMTEKIAQAGPFLTEQAATERPTLVIVPHANTPVDALPDGVRLLAWKQLGGCLRSPNMRTHAWSRPPRARWPLGRAASVGLVAALLALTVAGYAAWRSVINDWEGLRRQGDYAALDAALRQAWQPMAALYTALLKMQAPDARALSVDVTELRTADAGSCARRRLGGDRARG